MGMRSLKPAAVLATAFLVVIACGGQVGSPGPATSGTPGPATVKQNLIFTGPAAGTLTDAATQCQVFTAQAQLNFALTGKLSGQDLTLNIHVAGGYSGPGTYKIGSLLDGSGELRLEVGSYVGASSSGAGTLMIAPDGRSGSIDADLSGGEHIKGTFRCDQVQT